MGIPHREINPRDWDELKDMYSCMVVGWIFRGQRESSWGLKTSLERCFGSLMPTEAAVIKRFQGSVHHFLPAEKLPRTFVDVLALMQHHGAPTRLMDWTGSAFAATFFAIEDAHDPKDSCAVWAIQPHHCRTASVRAIRDHDPSQYEKLSMRTDFAEDDNLRKLVLGLKIPLVVPLKPEMQNQRMITQQGQFLAPGTIDESFDQNLSTVLGADVGEQLIKFVIPNSWREGILLDLRSMNITTASLFPGLDGFARSLYTSFSSSGSGGPWIQKVVEKNQKYKFPV